VRSIEQSPLRLQYGHSNAVLKLRQGSSEIAVPIRIFAPEQHDIDWACRFEIGWPDETTTMEIMGVDAVQALELAMKTIGAFIYSTDHHASGNLMWLEPGTGYGFPVSYNIRDILIGHDKTI
jgi:hypothetical protein